MSCLLFILCRKETPYLEKLVQHALKKKIRCYLIVDEMPTTKNPNIIYASDQQCIETQQTNFTSFSKITSWERCMYSLNRDPQFKHEPYVIVMEDDVFVKDFETILLCQSRWKDSDFVVKEIVRAPLELEGTWYGDEFLKAHPDLHNQEKPHAYSMVCCIAVSRRWLLTLQHSVQKYKKGFFHETFFPSLAVQNSLKILCPSELTTVIQRTPHEKNNYCWTPQEMKTYKESYFFHPVKDEELKSSLHTT